jgi:hypothetical protein
MSLTPKEKETLLYIWNDLLPAVAFWAAIGIVTISA